MNRPIAYDRRREIARRRLPRELFDFIDGGSFDEQSLRLNREAVAEIRLRQRVLNDVGSIDTATTLFGERLALPMVLAPIGMGGIVSHRKEFAAARAAIDCGVPMCLSTMSIASVGDLVAAGTPPDWFQLYMMRDRGFIEALLAQARAAGVKVLVLTVDLPVPGIRYKSNLSGQRSLVDRLHLMTDGLSHPRWLFGDYLRGGPYLFGNLAPAVPEARRLDDFWRWIAASGDPTVNWSDIAWIRQRWPGKLVLKGVLDVEDAAMAADHGADGLIVSNHGGRQLDSSPSPIEELPRIVDAIGGAMPVLVDGGIRSGIDLLKALASGAAACLVGRPWVYALASARQGAVQQLIDQFQAELKTAMALTGVTDIQNITRQLLVPR